MIWKAIMKDGSQILQNLNGVEHSFWDLDKDNVSSFSLVDSVQTLVALDLSSGDFNINNLSLEKLYQLNGGEKIELTYDKETEKFKMSPESLTFLNDMILKDEKSNNIGFDQTGKFTINGTELYLAFEENGELHEFINRPPYNNIVHFNEAFVDFIVSGNDVNPYKKIDATTAYNVGYEKEHTINDTTFKLSLVLRYNVVQKCVSLNCLITTDKDITGKLYLFYGNGQSTLDVTLYKDEPARLDRTITLI